MNPQKRRGIEIAEQRSAPILAMVLPFRWLQRRHPVVWPNALAPIPWTHVLSVLLFCLLPFSATAQTERPLPIFQREPRPMPSSVRIESDLRLEMYFSALKQGGVGLMRLSGDGIQRAEAEFRGESTPFFYLEGDAWYALIAADMNIHPRAHRLRVSAWREMGMVAFEQELRIEPGDFIVQELILPGDRAWLTDPEIESAELAGLAALTSIVGPAPHWDASGFELPHDSELTTPFGTVRAMDGGRESRHTGWDQNLPIGTPVRAMAAGSVAFAGTLDIRGNYLLIDHGLGLYSGYAHFSELHASAGQRVDAGQIIGLSGNSGRSSAPHLHWEIAFRGRWVDGRALLDLWLPASSMAHDGADAQD